jgi:AP-3 complex subunit beta
LQVLTLGGKLVALEGKSSKTINLLFQYVLNMARYDLDYNVRDRARFLRALVYGDRKQNAAGDQESEGHADGDEEVPRDPLEDMGGFEYSEKDLNLSDHVKTILLSEKPAPIQENPSRGMWIETRICARNDLIRGCRQYLTYPNALLTITLFSDRT